jgi:hypothetical protein
MSAAKVTTDHQEIRKWVEARGGKPAQVKKTGRGKDPGILRIDYPGFSGQESLQPLSWDEWFRAFDAHDLAFVHQDAVKGGPKSRFSKLVARDSVATGRRGSAAKRTPNKPATGTRSAARRSTAKRSTAKRSTAKRVTAKRATKRPSTVRTPRTTRTTRKSPRAAAGRISKRPAKAKRATKKKGR